MMSQSKYPFKIDSLISTAVQRQLDELNRSVAQSAIAQIERHARLPGSVINTISQLEEAAKRAQTQIALTRFENFNNKLIEQHQEILARLHTGAIERVFNQNKAIQERAFRNLLGSLEKSIPRINYDDYAQKEIQEVIDVASADSDDAVSLVENIEKNLIKRIKELPTGKVSLQGITEFILKLIVLLNFILLCIQLKRDAETSREISQIKEEQIETNEHLSKLNKLGESLVPYLHQLAEHNDDESLVIVTRDSPLRNKPSSEANSLGRLYPDQLLEILESQKFWFKVKYFDPTDSKQKLGWVYKGNVTLYK